MKGPQSKVLSICISAYQVEDYLEECLDSVVAQLTPDVDIWVIDDASTDATVEINRRYEDMIPALRVIRHEENKGLSGVRNTSLRMANSQWIFFMDGDDVLLPGAVQKLLAHANDSADAVVFDCIEFEHAEAMPEHCRRHDEFTIRTPEELLEYRNTILGSRQFGPPRYYAIPFVSAWGKLFKLSFFKENQIEFDLRLRQSQDLQFTFHYSRYLKEVKFIPQAIYGYRNNSGITRRYSEKVVERRDLLMTSLKETLIEEGEEAMKRFMPAYYARALYEMAEPMLEQSVAHPDCPMTVGERCAFLKNALSLSWVRETIAAYSTLPKCVKTRYKQMLIFLMKHRLYLLVDIAARARNTIKRKMKV